MYLSKLEIFGLKSFAHKEVFEFDDGITAIIGPNGCGKSNIVDAIRWVLGEQRPSILRLDRMENVIFNGTATRKPLNFAEVSLFIENNKNILPSIYSEVRITRRLYRSGESEYLINNRQVRLKDVIDLFSDTGMGADAYSVIELKMVEQILSDNADERRRLFEEAAGIKKYKLRRKSAMRKLESTDQELLRVNDVMSEVQKTVNSLSRQVGKARRYHQFRDELRVNDMYIYQLKKRAYGNELVPLREEDEQIRRSRDRFNTEINLAEAELEKLQAKSVDLENAFREVSGRLNKADDEIRDLQQTLTLNNQKIESLQRSISHSRAEIENLNARRETAKRQIDDILREKTLAGDQIEIKQNEYQRQANSQAEAEGRLEQARRRYQRFREENVNTLKEISAQREEYQRLSIQKQNIIQQLERQQSLQEKLATDLGDKQEKLDEVSGELEEARADAQIYEQEFKRALEQVADAQKNQRELEQQKNALIGEMEKNKSQRDFLQNLIHNYSGFSESVQFVMSNRKNYGGLIDTLANMVDTEENYRPALESFLQEIANYLIVDEVDTAQHILREIREKQKGRLTLVPLSLLSKTGNGKAISSTNDAGMIPLKTVVNYDEKFEPLFSYLFNDVMIVPDIPAALQWREKYPEKHYLTRAGEFIGNWGNISGGVSGKTLNLTGRKQQFEKLEKSRQKLTEEDETIARRLGELRALMSEKQGKAEEFDQLLKEQQKLQRQLEQRFNQYQYDLQKSGERLNETRDEANHFRLQIDELGERLKSLRPSVEQADEKQQRFHGEEARLNEQVETADKNYRSLSHQVQQLQIELLHQQNQMNELLQRENFTHKTLDEAGEQHNRIDRQITDFQAEIVEIELENAATKEILELRYGSRDTIEKEKNEVETSYQNLKSLILSREDEVKKLHRRYNQAQERIRELELAIQEYQIKQRTLEEQMQERYGAELFALLEKHPAPDDVSIQPLQEENLELRKKIEALGEVNPLAVKEYDHEKERLDFLKSQLADLLEAKDELVETIGKLNKTARKLFIETFEKIRDNFKNVFSKFFEGGEAQLSLVESADPLDANIDISVKIKGRRLSTLSMMSAGEKTLTATSLLFSIYLVKPSPFCILDEVDAPLDDVNVSRYNHALREFSDNTQFILVTHNKMTMQAAQAMYGVTMEEPGVSKVVSVRLD